MARIRVTGDGDGKAKKGEMKVGGEKKKRGTLSDHADILFPAQRILRQMKKSNSAGRIYKDSAVFLASSLEYIASDILALADEIAAANKRVRITPRHLTFAVRSDNELEKLFRGAVIHDGGVLPHVESALMARKPKAGEKKKARPAKKKATSKEESDGE